MKHGKSVAIVGVGGIFPMSPTLDLFWKTISGNVNTSRRPPAGRWLLEPDEVYDPKVGAPDKVYSKQGCYIDDDDAATLSLAGLDIDPDFVAGLDPMFHLLLHAGRQAFNDGGTDALDRSRVGVIIGNLALPSEYASAMARDILGRTFAEKLLGRSEPPAEPAVAPINRYVAGLPAGLLARALGLGGTSFTLDAACASSLYAIKLAVDELAAGRADAMLTGGLSRPDSLYTQMGFSQLHAVSPSGTCSPFDQKGDGLVVGEGCGMFLLKRTEDAVRDGDHIYAVIRGIGLSNDLGGSLLAPASEGQLRAMRSAYQQAGWNPTDVDLIECHATGTPVGDAVEFSSLKSLWGDSGWKRNQCVIGSVKSNIGHLLTAAGSAALTKVLLAMKEQTLPPTAQFKQPAKGIALADSPFRILSEPTPWNPRKQGAPRRAAVSAFGFGGINAHLLIEEWISPPPAKSSVAFPPSFQRNAQPVAIVGIGAHFGPWSSLQAVQQRMLGAEPDTPAGRPDRWWGAEKSQWFKESGLNGDDFKGYFVPEVSAVPGEFRIPPKELEEMLPRQLLMLQVADQALQDASLKGEDLLFTGVFIGNGLDLNATGFSFRWAIQGLARKWAEQLGRELNDDELDQWIAELREAAGPALTANRVMGALGSVVASRVAKEFRIGGPCFTLSSEENSGLRALEIAVRAIQEGSINRAIVGAADMNGDLRSVLGRHADRPFSADGPCRPFDNPAGGTLIGEGAAALVLKRLEDAQQDGDRIYAVIKGLGTATGGRAEDLIPGLQTVQAALQRAFQEARIKPHSISYLETHGSGIPGEDAVEAAALTQSIGNTASESPCWVGSVKAEIGHTGCAAGLASLIRAALCLHHQVLPPLRHSRLDSSPWTDGHRRFLPPVAPQYWLRNRAEGPRRALVSAFGVDGSCSVALLEGHEGKGKSRSLPGSPPLGALREGLFALDGSTPAVILGKIAALQKLIPDHPQADIEQLARLWFSAAPIDPIRARCLAMVAANRDELLSQLEYGRNWLHEHPEKRLAGNGNPPLPPAIRDRLFYTPEPLAGQGQMAFIFPGSGNQFAGMGRDLSVRWPEIFRAQDARSQHLIRQYLPQLFWGDSLDEAVHDNHNALVSAQVALGTAVSDLVRSFGIEPQAVSGYSLGESAGLFSFDAWMDREGMSRRLRESSLFTEDLAGVCKAAHQTWKLADDETVDWTLCLVPVPAAKVRKAIAGLPRVYLLIINTYEECVIGGNRAQVEKLVSRLGCPSIPLRGVTTVHCEVVDRVAQAYRELHRFPTTPPENIRFYSCALGRSYELDENSVADAILSQALDTIDYTKVIEQAYADGVRIFLEMGPGNSCSRMIGRILKDRPHLARAVCVPGQDAVSLILRLLAQGLAERIPVNLAVLYPDEPLTVKEKTGSRIRTVIGGAPFAPPKPKAGAPQPAPRPEPAIKPQPVVPKPAAAAVASTHEPPLSLPSVAGTAPPADNPLLKQLEQATAFSARSHEAFLRFSNCMSQALTENIHLQINLLQQMLAGGEPLPSDWQLPPMPERTSVTPQPVISKPPSNTKAPRFDRAMCMEFAVGSIAKMLGPEFAEVDGFPTRVRLPDEPLMLVDRILTVEGEPRSMTHGRVVTEHDVTADRWYLDGGRIPTCVAVEAGQADLFLSGYLGIDFITRGKAVYRLLDAVVTFHRTLPVIGDVIHYDIHIERFFRQDQTYLFLFNFEGTVNGEPLLTMKNGCAGFFSEEELAAGQGIVHTKLDLRPQPGKLPADWREPATMAVESYNEAQVNAIYQGDLAAGFGDLFAGLSVQRPYTLPGGLLKLVDRVIELDPKGGRYGLGRIRAEMDIRPDAWFLTCHFVDDKVMPGTLMYECCMHTLRIYLLRLGWIGEDGATWCEPVPGVDSGLKCRGQVTATTRTVTYQVSIKELGYGPEPFAIVDALMYADGKAIVEIPDMSVRLAGLNREKVEQLWQGQSPATAGPVPGAAKRVLYDYDRILAYSIGNPSEAFGEPYKVFDNERKIARLPGPPYQFLDRITEINGEPWKLVAGVTIEAEYDVPVDAWYFEAGRQPEMPFAILLEIGLQPCGWLAAYLGSALTSEIDMRFRNLDGNAVQHRPVTAASGTLTTKVKITRISSSGGMIIQGYDFEIRDSQGPVYTGDTLFGFFSAESLAQQVGIREAKLYQPSADEVARGEQFPYPTEAPYPAKQLRMVDTIELFVKDGGLQGLGFIRGTKKVDPEEWFFKAHFYQDPVCPGSLGLESFLQLLKVAAINRWGGTADTKLETVALGERHKWNYRGQIIPTNQLVTIEAVVTAVDDEQRLLKANGYLSVDGKVIYQMNDFTVRMGI